MASLPRSQRSSPTSHRSDSQTSPSHRTSSSNQEQGSDASSKSFESVLIGSAPPSQARIKGNQQEQSSGSSTGSERREASADNRRCWICFSDENEDTPTTSSWRSPCPCALTAHEACILDWVADMEGSNNGRPKQVLCPQCKSEIKIARPHSLFVNFIKAIEGIGNKLVLPAIATLGTTTVVYISSSYGAMAALMVLGVDDFNRIFGVVSSQGQAFRRVFGLSIVPWMLIFSRVTIADGVLPIVPMLFFVTQARPDPLVDFTSWPPSAGLSFAMLPYIRAAYNSYHEYVWGERERRWLREVKPRAGATDQNNRDEAALGLELEVEGMEEDDDDNEEDGNDEGGVPAAAPVQFEPPAPAPQPNMIQGAIRANNVRRDYNISLWWVAQNFIGALVFPGVSAAVGDLLRLALPTSWTSVANAKQKPTRLLQTRWGRSILGGCLFVVLKDAVTLYVRWKMAQNHRRRKVVDYNRSKNNRQSGDS